ncbi:MAG: hypothetical protein Q9165_005787 [Trypethelium subeluteriae]
MPSYTILKSALATLGVVQLAAGHTLFTNFYLDGVDQGNATCVRMPMVPNNATFPINNILGNEMACGYNGENGVAQVCPANAGSTITFEYRAIPDDSSAESIDISHKGPCAVYLKKVDSAINDTGVGDGWFKIWDDGYDETAGKWCTEKLRDNAGHLSVQIPSSLEGGSYLARPELLALHQADKVPSNPQFYVGCAQLFVNSTGTGKPTSTVSIPSYIQPMSPPVHFDIWTRPLALPYPLPGPAIANISTPSVSDSSTKDTEAQQQQQQQQQSEGLPPPSTILIAANWFGTELPPYTTLSGCYNASAACFTQARACYASAPPTGSFGCRIWEAHCDAIQAQCQSAGSADGAMVQGPPGYGEDLTPQPKTLSPVPSPSPTGAMALGKGNVEGSEVDAGELSRSASAVWARISGTAGASGPMVSQWSSAAPSPAASASSSAAAAVVDGGLKVSLDGACGGSTGQTCQGSIMGNCCSAHGYCGSSGDYCGNGCQAEFGTCGTAASMNLKMARKNRVRRARKHL